MKKATMLMIFIVFAVCGISLQSVSAADNVAFIDVDALFDNYNKTIELNKKLDATVQTHQAERDGKVTEIKQLQSELVLLATDARTGKQAEIDEKVKELQTYDEETRAKLAEERNTYMQEILVELDEKVKAYGAEKGYDFILNSRFALYKKDSFDVTDDILQRVNNQ